MRLYCLALTFSGPAHSAAPFNAADAWSVRRANVVQDQHGAFMRMAIALARRGCAVLVNYSRSQEGAEKTAAAVAARRAPRLAYGTD